jgi:hypothetical protein
MQGVTRRKLEECTCQGVKNKWMEAQPHCLYEKLQLPGISSLTRILTLMIMGHAYEQRCKVHSMERTENVTKQMFNTGLRY